MMPVDALVSPPDLAKRPPELTVVVPTCRRPASLARTVSSVLANTGPSREVVVVDDGGGDAQTTLASLMARGEPVRVIYQTNQGPAAARNTGAAAATGRVLLFIDDDIIVPPAHLSQHLAAHAASGPALITGHAVFPDELRASLGNSAFGRYRLSLEDHFAERAPAGELDARIPISGAPAANLSMSTETFARLGGFDASFPFAGAEDQDLALRARQAGIAVLHDFGIKVAHIESHLDLPAYCRRQERAAATLTVLARKYPENTVASLLELNGPIRRNDSARLLSRKIARAVLSRPLILDRLHHIVPILERHLAIDSPMLPTVYRAFIGLHVFRGVRDALQSS